MHGLIKYGFGLLFAVSASALYAEASPAIKPLEIGVVPYLSARVLVTSYEPMRRYLEQALGRPVKIYTSTGFKQFFLDAQRGDYDLVISAAHFARILQTENTFKPLVRYASGGRGLVMTALDGPLKTPHDLQGQVIAVPDPLSLSAIVCFTWLNEKGLRPGIDFKILEVASFASAILAIQKGDAMAAISAPGALAQMPGDLSGSVRPLIDTGEFVSLVFLSHPRLGKHEAERLKNVLLKFNSKSKEGKQFFLNSGFGDITPVLPKDMYSLDRYVAETKRLLTEKQ